MIELQVQQEIEENATLLKIIAHPTRLQIISILLMDQNPNVNDIVIQLKIPQSTVSQHLAKMKGIVVGCDKKGLEVYYYINNPKIAQLYEILT
ncbi:TPA: helix-turn-helix transcriptional regulator [Bacillus cereus]|nr:helix-turn-helix transcriptional regulator [Bacillus cereus]